MVYTAYLFLNTNVIQGQIPSELGLLGLTSFTAHMNNLEGTIPEELWQISGLQQLRLGSNRLSGTLSNAVGNLKLVKELFLNDNQLDGSMPLFLGRLSTLGTWVSGSRVN
jgi:Leucine-rich repeat (LRR) protein